jgi:hypothetical protein
MIPAYNMDNIITPRTFSFWKAISHDKDLVDLGFNKILGSDAVA